VPAPSGEPAEPRALALAALVAAKLAKQSPPKLTAAAGDFDGEDKDGCATCLRLK
jgi:hypothetical protein